MAGIHPNIALLEHVNPVDLDAASDVIAEDFVWHYVNPRLPEIQGDYVGLEGFRSFFEKLAVRTGGTFKVSPVSITPYGDELVVVHTRNSLNLDGQSNTVDVIIVWRIVDGKLAEAWDIPSVHAQATGDT